MNIRIVFSIILSSFLIVNIGNAAEFKNKQKLTNAANLLQMLKGGEQTVNVIVTIKPSQQAAGIAANAAKQMGVSVANNIKPENYGKIRYNLKDKNTKKALKNSVKFGLDEFFNNMPQTMVLQSSKKGLKAQSVQRRAINVKRKFDYVFSFAAEVTEQGLQELAENENVMLIEEDLVLQPHLDEGITLMNGDAYRGTYDGSGVAIAVADTGIDDTHTYLDSGKVLGGYDFGEDDADYTPEGNAHGTAVAGIAAGDLANVGDYVGGVAPAAKLYSLKISNDTNHSATSSDMIAAWEWALTHQNDDVNNPIMVINTSFGGGYYKSLCDSASSGMTQAALNAKNAGISLFVSSGNDGFCDGMGWPACISHVNSVGAVYDANIGAAGWCVSTRSCLSSSSHPGCSSGTEAFFESTLTDKVTAYSNSASFLTFFASSNNAYTTDISGSGGYSSGDYTTSFGGTSAASPYAAGAAAVLQHAAKQLAGSFLTPDEVRTYFQDYGDNVADSKVVITKPRINIASAIAALPGQPDAFETDDSFAQAVEVNSSVVQTHSIDENTDLDMVKIVLSQASTIIAYTSGLSNQDDTVMTLFDSLFTQIATDDDSGQNKYSRIDTSELTAGTYYLRVNENGQDATIARYILNISLPGIDDEICFSARKTIICH